MMPSSMKSVSLSNQELHHTTTALSIIQLFSTLSYAVLYSTLVLYATQKLALSISAATAMMGTFGAFNYGLHLLGGYFGGRFFTWRTLFMVGMLAQVIGCFILATPQVNALYTGLAFFLMGSGLNVTCINMMVTQLFDAHDKRRENAFFWNYAFMNVGFFIGYAMAGYFQLNGNFYHLFIASAMGNIIAILITFAYWDKLVDRNTFISRQNKNKRRLREMLGLGFLVAIVGLLDWFVRHPNASNDLVLGFSVAITILVITLALHQKNTSARSKMFAYILFTFSALIFWTLYQLAPMALTVFTQYNVNRHLFGFEIAPQWIQNINTLVIALGGPLLGFLLPKLQRKGIHPSLALKFSLALTLVGSSLIILPVGIKCAAQNGLISFQWIVLCYLLQSVGELFIGPIGYAMIGQLAPQNLQGLLMGTWMLSTGTAFVFSNHASTFAIQNMTTTNPLVTNSGYAHMFNLLGGIALIAGFLLFLFAPALKKLAHER